MAQVMYLFLLFMFYSIFGGFVAIDIAQLVQYIGGINVAEFADQSFHVSFDIFENISQAKDFSCRRLVVQLSQMESFLEKMQVNACKRFLSQDERAYVSLYNRINPLVELCHRWKN